MSAVERAAIIPSQGARLTDVSIKDIASFGETVGIQNQPRVTRRTIRPLLLGMTEVRLAVVLPRPLKKGVGQIIENERLLQLEQALPLPLRCASISDRRRKSMSAVL